MCLNNLLHCVEIHFGFTFVAGSDRLLLVHELQGHVGLIFLCRACPSLAVLNLIDFHDVLHALWPPRSGLILVFFDSLL